MNKARPLRDDSGDYDHDLYKGEVESYQQAQIEKGEAEKENDDCPECHGEIEPLSNCCGAKLDTDLMLCMECHDHAEFMECETCGRTPQ